MIALYISVYVRTLIENNTLLTGHKIKLVGLCNMSGSDPGLIIIMLSARLAFICSITVPK